MAPPLALTVTVEVPPWHRIGVADELAVMLLTVRITSSVLIGFPHGPEALTLSRSVTVRGEPVMVAPVDKVLGELMVTPVQLDTHDQVVAVIGLVPGWAVPVRLKLVVPLGSAHLLWSGPASAVGPITKGGLICWGTIKSTMFADGDWDVLVLIKIVLMPRVRQGSKLPSRAVRSTAASANVLVG